MLKLLKKLIARLFRRKTRITVSNTTGSQVIIKEGPGDVHINRPMFQITEAWLASNLQISYDNEIKSKYIPELHQDQDFERIELIDILDFGQFRRDILKYCAACKEKLDLFALQMQGVEQVLSAEGIAVIDTEHYFLQRTSALTNAMTNIYAQITSLQELFNCDRYELLANREKIVIVPHPVDNTMILPRNIWKELFDKRPSDLSQLITLAHTYSELYYELNGLNYRIDPTLVSYSHKIIVGAAGTGKTHTSAHLITRIKENGDFVLFFKAKQFSGDNVNLDSRIMELLSVPEGYRLDEVLEKLDAFAKGKGKRCFIIIDALNETTRSAIGFSNIWEKELPVLINRIEKFKYLYLVCTLRTSYIDKIWPVRPAYFAELKDFSDYDDVIGACKKYFHYYRILPTNLDSADLRLFQKPLLLDLFCKLVNQERLTERAIKLDSNTYLQIFEDYVAHLVKEVQTRLKLQMEKPIKTGLMESSVRFLANNEAILELDDFSEAFDPDERVSVDTSIAYAVLEGYLLFIRDFNGKKSEIVKHTQQEVGGYLLARMLSDRFPDIDKLLSSKDFKEKIIGPDSTKHHQLRLDILKFLIAINPGIIIHLNDAESLGLSWLYLFDGQRTTDDMISDYLLANTPPDVILSTVLAASTSKWYDNTSSVNFDYIAKLLGRLSQWDFDASWTFYVYLNHFAFHNEITAHINRLRNGEYTTEAAEAPIAKMISFVTATTSRELRDHATVYLIEMGKRFPFLLLQLTKYSAGLPDTYIYERLAACCYGVAMIRQHDQEFVEGVLPRMTISLLSLQFGPQASHPVYNYIVVDSIKHLADLAAFKNVIRLDEEYARQIKDYQIVATPTWIGPSADQKNLINRSSEMDWPEPIGMDFGIYTIPRLLKSNIANRRAAIANVYSRIYGLGYKDLSNEQFQDERFQKFYYGDQAQEYGKRDRLGKKYSWKGFFDYAGFLLRQGELNVFEERNASTCYDRLSDVDIDISMPSNDYKIVQRVYPGNLMAGKGQNEEWYKEDKIDTIAPYFRHIIDGVPYILLHGSVNQMADQEYKVRAAIWVEAHLIQTNGKLDELKAAIKGTREEWDNDLHFYYDQIRHGYFGELYWADNMVSSGKDEIGIASGRWLTVVDKVTMDDVLSGKHNAKELGKEVEVEYPETLWFDREPALAEYLWESKSKTLPGFSEYYPSIKMGRDLELKADPLTGKVLDNNMRSCFQSINFEDQGFSNEFSYFREDLLMQYLKDNNLALLYQVKQHFYDLNYVGNRYMKYFLLEA